MSRQEYKWSVGTPSEDLWVSQVDYDVFSTVLPEWWAKWNRAVLRREILPQLGLMVWRGQTPLLNGWLYTTDSWVGWLAWVIRNPEIKPTDEVWDALIITMKDLAYELGIRTMMCASNHPSIIRQMTKHDFRVSVQNIKHMYAGIGGD